MGKSALARPLLPRFAVSVYGQSKIDTGCGYIATAGEATPCDRDGREREREDSPGLAISASCRASEFDGALPLAS